MEKVNKKKDVSKKEQVKISSKKERKEQIKVSSDKIIGEDVKKEIKVDNYNKQKTFKIFGILVLLIVVIGLSFVYSDSYGGNVAQYEFININLDEYLEMMNSEEKLIVYLARPGCGWCNKETPIIKRLASKNDLTIYYLDTTDFYDYENEVYTEKGEKFINSSERYAKGYGTPNTIIIQNGEVIDGIFQFGEANDLKMLFKSHGFIK